MAALTEPTVVFADLSQLTTFFGAAARLGYVTCTLFEAYTPGAEAALRLWAHENGRAVEVRTHDYAGKTPPITVVTCDLFTVHRRDS